MQIRRLTAIVIGILALLGTATGIVLAAEQTSPVSADLTSLDSRAPRSAQVEFTIENSDGTSIDGAATMDFRNGKNAMNGYIEIPVVIAKARINLRLVGKNLYVGSPLLRSSLGASWLSSPIGAQDLTGVALEMASPEFSLLSSMLDARHTVTHDGDHTVHFYQSVDPATRKRQTVTVTTGAQGQVLEATIHVPTGRLAGAKGAGAMDVHLHVVSYNQPVSIAAPPRRDVKLMTSDALSQLSGGNPLLQQILGGSSLF